MNVVLASSNPGKLAELTVLLAPFGVALSLQQQLGVVGCRRNGRDLRRKRADQGASRRDATGQAAIADDSGLVVPALGGAPGVSFRAVFGSRTATRRRTTAS